MTSTHGGAVGTGGNTSGDRVQKVKVKRYWAGKRPDWGEEEEEEEALQNAIANRGNKKGVKLGDSSRASAADDRSTAPGRRRDIRAAVVVAGDGSDDSSDEEDASRRRARARGPVQPEKPTAVVDDNNEDDDEFERRRDRARQQMRERETAEVLGFQDEDEEAEDESDSEYETETESEDELLGMRQIAKPVFVRKAERESVIEREKKEAEEEAAYEEQLQRKEERKVDTRQMIASEIAKEQEGPTGVDEADDWDPMPDDDDDEDEAAEYEAWKIRELRRVKREHDEREAIEREKAEITRRRTLTDAQILAEDKDAFKNKKTGMKEEKWAFMQKYYHRGAFFQETNADGTGMAEPLFQRDVGGKTLEDHFNKESLPKVLQVKNFGKMSRTKWTHLKDNDTTQGDSLYNDSDFAQKRTKDRHARAGGTLDRPSGKKSKSS